MDNKYIKQMIYYLILRKILKNCPNLNVQRCIKVHTSMVNNTTKQLILCLLFLS